MSERAQAFSYPGGAEEAGGAPSGPGQAPKGQGPEDEEGPARQQAQAAQLMQGQEAARREREAQPAPAPQGQQTDSKKEARKFMSRAAKMGQAGFAETGVTLLTLAAQLVAETIQKWVFPKKGDPPPKLGATDVGVGCAMGCSCMYILMLFMMLIFPMAFIAAFASNPVEMYGAYLGALYELFIGLFKG
jgi:hypothetical protein